MHWLHLLQRACIRCRSSSHPSAPAAGLPVARALHTRADMAKKILVTGGAGFIGSHLCDRLLAGGYDVRVLDNLCPQVHGVSDTTSPVRPRDLAGDVELIVGDVRDARTCRRALLGIDAVIHLAARV